MCSELSNTLGESHQPDDSMKLLCQAVVCLMFRSTMLREGL
jgi:hypothetical protein